MSIRLSASGDDLRTKFFALQTRKDIAELLEINDKQLIYHLYICSPHQKYKVFNITKKSGQKRIISAPISSVKIIQSKLNQVLQYVYRAKPSVHGFIHNKNIVTNARMHLRRRLILNVDLKDFFPSINFGRVRGMFLNQPYNFNEEVATVLAQICCHNNQLPQGAPTSPTVSNMICSKLDDQLQKLARKYQCLYTRYADDITFSTHLTRFPEKLAKYSEDAEKFEVGPALRDTIESNGFKINESKVRMQPKARRQQVTGLNVNSVVNVRRKYVNQIRAMLHAWEKYGLDLAEQEFVREYDKKRRHSSKRKVSFSNVVKGKIEYLGMVRGHQDPIYLKHYDHYCRLAGIENKRAEAKPSDPVVKKPLAIPLVITEGKTDWKHMKTAFSWLKSKGLYEDFYIDFNEYENEFPAGSKEARENCIRLARFRQDKMHIFVFDNDEKDIIRDMVEKDKSYKSWGNNVFSLVIPTPSHRQDTPEVCIELYYKDQEITRFDKFNRRLFLSNEFRVRSGRHQSESLIYTNTNRLKNDTKLFIIDSQVLDDQDRNVALTKSDYADYVLNREDNFMDFDCSEFKAIFDIIAQIVVENSQT